MSTRNRRHQRILDLIDRQSVRSQQSLRSLLAREGIDVTQATLSRDLRQLGLVKGAEGYLLPGRNGTHRNGSSAALNGAAEAADEHGLGSLLAEAVRSSVVSVQQAASVVVLKTGPGRAQPVAVELDRTPPEGAAGTIAGDDTVFIAAVSPREAKRIVELIERAAGIAREAGGAW
jgi:transcriptional regulator of arginine metabolism